MKSAASSRPIVLTASLGAVAVVGLGMFGYFGIDGLSRRADLDRCQGRCTDADVDRVESRFLLADVGLGIAVVAGAAAAAVVWFTGATSSREPDRNRRASALPASPGVLSFPGTF